MRVKKVSELTDIKTIATDQLPLNLSCYVSNGSTSKCITYEQLIENLKRDLNLN